MVLVNFLQLSVTNTTLVHVLLDQKSRCCSSIVTFLFTLSVITFVVNFMLRSVGRFLYSYLSLLYRLFWKWYKNVWYPFLRYSVLFYDLFKLVLRIACQVCVLCTLLVRLMHHRHLVISYYSISLMYPLSLSSMLICSFVTTSGCTSMFPSEYSSVLLHRSYPFVLF